jgi:hypothetical protein
MILLRVIGFFIVIIAVYSFGAVAGSRSKSMTSRRAPSPCNLDLAVIILSWLGALAAYLVGYRTAVATIIGAGIGLFASLARYRTLKQIQGDNNRAGNSGRETLIAGIESSTSASPQLGNHVQPPWRLFVRQVGGFQSRLMLSAFYFIALMPFGILVGNLGDPLGVKVPPGESFWKRREDDSQSLEEARRQS